MSAHTRDVNTDARTRSMRWSSVAGDTGGMTGDDAVAADTLKFDISSPQAPTTSSTALAKLTRSHAPPHAAPPRKPGTECAFNAPPPPPYFSSVWIVHVATP